MNKIKAVAVKAKKELDNSKKEVQENKDVSVVSFRLTFQEQQ